MSLEVGVEWLGGKDQKLSRSIDGVEMCLLTLFHFVKSSIKAAQVSLYLLREASILKNKGMS